MCRSRPGGQGQRRHGVGSRWQGHNHRPGLRPCGGQRGAGRLTTAKLYAPKEFQALRGAFAGLQPIDQLGIRGDTWAMAMAGVETPANYMDLAKASPPPTARRRYGVRWSMACSGSMAITAGDAVASGDLP